VRISWEQYALDIARTASSRSEDHHVKVGACALNSQQMVVAVGYNGLASGKDVSYDFWRNRDHRRKFMIHAEVNCLSLFQKGEAEMLAVTLLPCSSCATMIAGYGISKVIYGDTYKRDTVALEIFDFYDIECIKYGN
tara:strand:- start:425 stop:835 length:411 start_codon:yes stop_codon:yes gene_type:complete